MLPVRKYKISHARWSRPVFIVGHDDDLCTSVRNVLERFIKTTPLNCDLNIQVSLESIGNSNRFLEL